MIYVLLNPEVTEYRSADPTNVIYMGLHLKIIDIVDSAHVCCGCTFEVANHRCPRYFDPRDLSPSCVLRSTQQILHVAPGFNKWYTMEDQQQLVKSFWVIILSWIWIQIMKIAQYAQFDQHYAVAILIAGEVLNKFRKISTEIKI